MRSLRRVLSAAGVSVALLATPGLVSAASKPTLGAPTGAVIERIVFEGVLPFEQGIVLDRIGVKPGDVLTDSTIQRIARQLTTLRVPRGFAYQQGTKPGRIVLSIGAGC